MASTRESAAAMMKRQRAAMAKQPRDGNVLIASKGTDAFISVPVVRGSIPEDALIDLAKRFSLQLDGLYFETLSGQVVLGDLTPNEKFYVCGTGVAATSPPKRRVVFGYSPRMLLHRSDRERVPETPTRVERALEELHTSGLLAQMAFSVRARKATLKEVALVHATDIFGDFVTHGTSLSSKIAMPTDLYCEESTSSDSALTAAGICIDGAQVVYDDPGVDCAFCLVRPPGHHCGVRTPHGFCLLNNVAIAARCLTSQVTLRGLPPPRIAIIDFDVHHGDGTQSVFLEDPNVLFISLHRYDHGKFFPYSGHVDHIGAAQGRGYSINIPFDTSSRPSLQYQTISDEAFDAVAVHVVVPVLRQYQPNLIFLSCGFDAGVGDPLGRMNVVNGFKQFVGEVMDVKAALAECRGIVCCLEGGYNVTTLFRGVSSVVETLLHHTNNRAPKEYITPPAWTRHPSTGERSAPVDSPADDDHESPDEPLCAEVPSVEQLHRLHSQWIRETLKSVALVHSDPSLPFAAVFTSLLQQLK